MKSLIKQNKIDIGYDFAGMSNYLILTINDESTIYDNQIQVISSSKTELFLPVRRIQLNNEFQLFYDITDRATLSQLTKNEPLEKSIFLHILENIINAMIETRELNLFDTGVLLDKRYIFLEKLTDIPSFIYVPFYKESNGNNNIIRFLKELQEDKLLGDDYGLEIYNIIKLAGKKDSTLEELLLFINDLVLLNPLRTQGKVINDDFNSIKIDEVIKKDSSTLVSLKHQDLSSLVEPIDLDKINDNIDQINPIKIDSNNEGEVQFYKFALDRINIIDMTEKKESIENSADLSTDGEFEIKFNISDVDSGILQNLEDLSKPDKFDGNSFSNSKTSFSDNDLLDSVVTSAPSLDSEKSLPVDESLDINISPIEKDVFLDVSTSSEDGEFLDFGTLNEEASEDNYEFVMNEEAPEDNYEFIMDEPIPEDNYEFIMNESVTEESLVNNDENDFNKSYLFNNENLSLGEPLSLHTKEENPLNKMEDESFGHDENEELAKMLKRLEQPNDNKKNSIIDSPNSHGSNSFIEDEDDIRKEDIVIKEEITLDPSIKAFQERQKLFDLSDKGEEPFTIIKDEFKLDDGITPYSDRNTEEFDEEQQKRRTGDYDVKTPGRRTEDFVAEKISKRPFERRDASRLRFESSLSDDKNVENEFEKQLLRETPISMEDLKGGEMTFATESLIPDGDPKLTKIDDINLSKSIASLDGASDAYRERRSMSRDSEKEYYTDEEFFDMRAETSQDLSAGLGGFLDDGFSSSITDLESTIREDISRVSNVGSDLDEFTNTNNFQYEDLRDDDDEFYKEEDKGFLSNITNKIPFFNKNKDNEKEDIRHEERISTIKPKQRKVIEDKVLRRDKSEVANKIDKGSREYSSDSIESPKIAGMDKGLVIFLISQVVLVILIIIISKLGFFGKVFRTMEIYDKPATNIIARIVESVHSKVNIPLLIVVIIIFFYLEFFMMKNFLFSSPNILISENRNIDERSRLGKRKDPRDFNEDFMPGKEISNLEQAQRNHSRLYLEDTEETQISGGQKIPYLTTKVEGTVQKIFLNKESFIIGRHVGKVDYVSKSNKVGKMHLEIINRDGVFYISDLNSTNGTYINTYTNRVQSNIEYPISDGDIILLADAEFTFHQQ